jgi:hypothetical protein
MRLTAERALNPARRCTEANGTLTAAIRELRGGWISFVNLGTLAVVQGGKCRRRGLLQLPKQLIERLAKLL